MAEIGGMTRSGRCYTPEELESKRKKGKEKVGEAPGMEEAARGNRARNKGVYKGHQEK